MVAPLTVRVGDEDAVLIQTHAVLGPPMTADEADAIVAAHPRA
jgi:hypothetical protein